MPGIHVAALGTETSEQALDDAAEAAGEPAASAAATAEAVQEFRVHLASGKFAGTDTDGSRRDWIATADVTAWLARITAAGG